MRRTAMLIALLAAWMTVGSPTASPRGQKATPQIPWRTTLRKALPVMGHRNWIVIADAAYPAQSSAGIQTIYTGDSQLTVVKAVLAELKSCKHVTPAIMLDKELDFVDDSAAPGIAMYRDALQRLLVGRRVTQLPHEEIIAKLDEAGKVFRVLILKTNMTLPYTSVFLNLDCGYWTPEQEKAMRSAMESRHK